MRRMRSTPHAKRERDRRSSRARASEWSLCCGGARARGRQTMTHAEQERRAYEALRPHASAPLLYSVFCRSSRSSLLVSSRLLSRAHISDLPRATHLSLSLARSLYRRSARCVRSYTSPTSQPHTLTLTLSLSRASLPSFSLCFAPLARWRTRKSSRILSRTRSTTMLRRSTPRLRHSISSSMPARMAMCGSFASTSMPAATST